MDRLSVLLGMFTRKIVIIPAPPPPGREAAAQILLVAVLLQTFHNHFPGNSPNLLGPMAVKSNINRRSVIILAVTHTSSIALI